MLKQVIGATTVGSMGVVTASTAGARPTQVVRKGRIHQSIASWCFCDAGQKWSLDRLCGVAKDLGCLSVELVEPKDFPILKKHGLVCAITPNGMPDAPFVKGLNNPRYQDEVVARTQVAIEATAAAGFPNVIAFTGFKWRNVDDPSQGELSLEEGARHCLTGLKRLAAHAEKHQVTVCIEMLNTRDDSHPMKGHPGYMGDHLDYVAQIVRKVGSPRVKLLFDIYHVQVMDGDLLRRIRQYHDLIGHVHTAGNPGRCELDGDQEIQFAACMKTLLANGYRGYVGHEYIPTRDPLTGLQQAVTLCDV